MFPIALGLLLAQGACERRGVQEHNVEKGVEQPPIETQTPPAASGVAGGEGEVGAPSDRWSVPPDWVLVAEPRPMRVATYLAPDPGGAVEVAITRFDGRVGGELANVNRWRSQMGLEPLDASGLDTAMQRFSSPEHEGYEVRIESAAGVLLAAGVYETALDQTWFVRATVADPAIADRLQDAVFGVARSIAAPGGDGG